MTAISPSSIAASLLPALGQQVAAGNGRLFADGAQPGKAGAAGQQSGERDASGKALAGTSKAELSAEEQRKVTELAARDREVRAHEAAHANVGGVYAGAPTYSYTRGPDGRNYAVGGEVSIDVSPVAGDPQATINKAQLVRRAALAPAEPSPQDRSVANQAIAMEQQARAELQAEKRANGEPGSNPVLGAVSITASTVFEPGEIIDELI
ncbi:MAG: hypothetical protein HKO71_02605 [Pseudomonadales bacterium]|nr:hypothetical protein [Gammaproteobacteria bacterium]NNL56618.1 hypothetical protein [Pseudomonadales bacterium]